MGAPLHSLEPILPSQLCVHIWQDDIRADEFYCLTFLNKRPDNEFKLGMAKF